MEATSKTELIRHVIQRSRLNNYSFEYKNCPVAWRLLETRLAQDAKGLCSMLIVDGSSPC
jgi:hypothetical protein